MQAYANRVEHRVSPGGGGGVNREGDLPNLNLKGGFEPP